MKNTEVSLADVRKKMKSQITREHLLKKGFGRHGMTSHELCAIYQFSKEADIFDVISLVFMYGASKGYCFAKNQKMKEGNAK